MELDTRPQEGAAWNRGCQSQATGSCVCPHHWLPHSPDIVPMLVSHKLAVTIG